MKLILTTLLFSVLSLSAVHEVKMLNSSNGQSMTFEPSYLKVNPGDTVKFIPTEKGHNSQSVFTPDDGEQWEGKTSKEVSVTLSKEGIYIYECKNHKVMGMNGVIQVGEPKNLDEAKEFVEKYIKKIPINKTRLKTTLEGGISSSK